MGTTWQFGWQFEPESYFRTAKSIDLGQYTAIIEAGTITVEVPFSCSDDDTVVRYKLRQELEKSLNHYMAAFHIVEKVKAPFELSSCTCTRRRPGGQTDLFVDKGIVAVGGGEVHFDVLTKDFTGTVVRDTKKEREEASSSIVQKARHDPLLSDMLLIYRLAIEHKTEMLLHLRKIHEMLACDRKGLGISNRDWKFVGKICNDSRLYEAAPRKKDDAGNELRHATTEELDSVLMHVQIWIAKYADSLSDPQ